jgi:hypothetical protein
MNKKSKQAVGIQGMNEILADLPELLYSDNENDSQI